MSGVNEWLISLSEYIGGMSDELDNAKAENTKLREQSKRLFDKTLELATENAKLRELALEVYMLNRNGLDCTECPWLDECKSDGGCPWLGILHDRMRDLGVEVVG